MLALPGWAALSLSEGWRQWKGLQRWIVAVGLSIAFYPALFYSTRSIFPSVRLGPYKIVTLLLMFAIVIGWRMRKDWREQFSLDTLEWMAVAVFGMTLFTRFWVIREQPYPAWSDSLHHTLLTQLTAIQGQLPKTMEPYFPIPLGQYHLGLYSLSATVQWLGQVRAHTALLWVAQALNGLCGLGVYLVLDRKVGRIGAIVGAVSVGLLSHQPAFYVNWGRFTQLSSQTILLIAWVVTLKALATWKLPWQEHKVRILLETVLAGVLSGGVFLLHFRVAAFYLPLLTAGAIWHLRRGYKERRLGSVASGLAAVGIVSLLITLPAIGKAVSIYVSNTTSSTPSHLASEVVSRYYQFPWSTVPYLVAHTWLLTLFGLSAAVGLRKRNRLVITSLLWMLVLYLLGRAYLLSVPLLSFTNLGAVLIMLYLPISLTIGCAVEELLWLCKSSCRQTASRVILGCVMSLGFVTSHIRAADIEPYRYFVAPGDVTAMDWIRENTPQDALFAVNTHFWLPRTPHGTDGGYWIPYFTGRQTTAGTMLLHLGSNSYKSRVVDLSRSVEELENGRISLADLRAQGIDYVYVGQRGDFSGPGIQPDKLEQAPQAQQVYANAGVSIYQIVSLERDPDEKSE